MASKTKVQLGSVSHGTMRAEDLIPCFIGVLHASGKRALANKYEREYNSLDMETSDGQDIAADILSDLFDALDGQSPDYTTFGAHEGDGADYGFWPSWDAIEKDAHRSRDDSGRLELVKVPDMSRAPVANASAPKYVLNVNNHGNATLYRHAGHRWVEIWSVV